LMSLLESISVSLQHLDALLTGYEIDPSTTDLNSLSDHLRSDYDRLEMLNESKSLSKVKREKYSVKVDYLNALYADLLLRLQKLQKGCDHSVQVDTLKFERDVGLQTDDINDSDPASVQESGSQTDVDSLTWVETWIESTMQILNTIEEISLTTNNCLNVLQDLQNVQNEFCEYSNNPDQNSEILQKKLKIVAEKTEKVRDATLQTCHWDELVKSTIESQNESEIQTLLTLIPQGAPHSRKLKEALKNLQKFPRTTPPETDPDDPDDQQRSSGSFLWRVARFAIPIQAGLLILLGISSIVPINKEEIICSVQNTFRDSLEPMMEWTNGSPPI